MHRQLDLLPSEVDRLPAPLKSHSSEYMRPPLMVIFVDGLLREQYSQTSLNAPGDFLFGQQLDAHGWAFAGSTGYNWAVPNSNWFIEPSAGVSISRTKVDPLNFVTTGTPGFSTFGETLQVNEIKSDIGRLGLRVGDTIQAGNIVWQPFGAFSVWHEFGPNITANAVTCPGLTATQSCAFSEGRAPLQLPHRRQHLERTNNIRWDSRRPWPALDGSALLASITGMDRIFRDSAAPAASAISSRLMHLSPTPCRSRRRFTKRQS